MAKLATIEKVFRKDKAPNGKGPIHIRVTKRRRVRYVPTGISVHINDWNQEGRFVEKSHRQYRVLNNLINQEFLAVEDFVMHHERENPDATVAEIKEAYLKSNATTEGDRPGKKEPIGSDGNQNGESSSFIVFFRKHLRNLEQAEKWGTLKKAEVVFSKLETYMKKVLRAEDLYFGDIDASFLWKYEIYLRKKHKNSTNTIYKEMSQIRALFNAAIDDPLLDVDQNQYPFRSYKLTWEKKRKAKLREDGIDAIQKLEIDPKTKDWHIRQMYLFAVHCGGMRISDLLTLQVRHYDGERIRKVMFKTDIEVNFIVTPAGKRILDNYVTDESYSDDYIFPLLDNRKKYNDSRILYQAIWTRTAYINKRLKVMGKRAGVPITLTSHTGRGTFVTQSVRKGMGLDFVQGIVGHQSRKTTETYLFLDQDDLDAAMRDAYGINVNET